MALAWRQLTAAASLLLLCGGRGVGGAPLPGRGISRANYRRAASSAHRPAGGAGTGRRRTSEQSGASYSPSPPSSSPPQRSGSRHRQGAAAPPASWGRRRQDGGWSEGRSASWNRGRQGDWQDDDEMLADEGWGEEEQLLLPAFAIDEEADYVYGVSSVLSALTVGRRNAKRLLLQDSIVLANRKDGGLITTAERMATEAGVPVLRVDKHRLNLITNNRPHQGIALEAEKLNFSPIRSLPPPPEGGARPVWLALDEVTDPQNLGSLLRSALFLGAAGVLVSEKNSAPLTPAVSRASAGAMELMTVHSTRNLVRTLNDAKEAGWTVAGASFDNSVTVNELNPTAPIVLVLGSEGKGLRTSVLRECSALVRVSRARSGASAVLPEHELLLDSLNVGVAGGVLLSALIEAGAAAK